MIKFRNILNEIMSEMDYGGWILPDGKFVKVQPQEHSRFLYKLSKTPKYRKIFEKNPYGEEKYDPSYENAISNGFSRIVIDKYTGEIGVEARQDKFYNIKSWLHYNAPFTIRHARIELYDKHGEYVNFREIELN